MISLNLLIPPGALEVKYLARRLHAELEERKDPAQQNTSVGANTGSLGRIGSMKAMMGVGGIPRPEDGKEQRDTDRRRGACFRNF